MARLANFLGYQAVWFAAVIGAGHGLWWPGVLASAAFVGWQLGVTAHLGADLRLLATALVAGGLIDGVLSVSGWARYAAAAPALPPGGAPLWILALWASFALTLNSSMAYLRNRPVAALLLGLIGGPLAYMGAARGWQALAFIAPQARGLAWLAAGWAVAMPLLAFLARRWTLAPASRSTAPEAV